jgi:hypothetical protein
METVHVKWDQVISFNESPCKPILRWINLGNGTLFRISAFFVRKKDKMPKDGIFVAIERVGSFLFAIDAPIHFSYVSEKLYVPKSDARAIADWINAQIGHETEQQGNYCLDYLEETLIINVEEWPFPALSPKIKGNQETYREAIS